MDFLGIGDAIVQAFRTFFGYIAATIYSLIDNLYHVFELVARAEIINSDFIQNIYKNIGLILSIFMLFKLVFSGIQSLIDPDKLSDKKNGYGQIILRSVIAVVLLGTIPAIFREAYTIQNFVVGSNSNDNVLYKLVAGKNTSGNSTIGRDLASTMYFAFFTETSEGAVDRGRTDAINNNNSAYYDRFRADDYATLVEDVTNDNRGFYDTIDYLSFKDGYDYAIDVNWIPLLVVGGFILWMIAMYTIQIGIRVVQLAYLQIIAPIPILSYISDPEGSFKKWTDQCIATYLDLFFRLMIIYFIMTLIGDILKELKPNSVGGVLYASTGLAGEDTLTRVLVIAVIIIGLLLFAKKVPELIKDIFPNFGGAGKFSFSLKPPKEVTGGAKFGAGLAIGGIAGMASGIRNGYGVKGKIAGAFGGLKHGALGGAKTEGNVFKNVSTGMSNTRQARQRVLDKQMYKLDKSDAMKEYKRNEEIIAAKKAIDDLAETEMLKTDANLIQRSLRIKELEENIGHFDATLMRKITATDVVNAKSDYKTYLDTNRGAWVDSHMTDTRVATQMQKIENKTGTKVTNYANVNTVGTKAKTDNSKVAREITINENTKEKMQEKKDKIK